MQLRLSCSYLVLLLAVLIVPAGNLAAQTDQQDMTPTFFSSRPSEATIGFDKLLNRYNWNTGLLYNNTFGPVSLFVDQHFLSSLISTDRNYLRDENNLDFALKHDIGDHYNGILRAGVYSLSDDQNVALGKAASDAVQYGIEMTPLAHLAFTPMVGVRYDKQLGRHDNGLVYSIGVATSGLEAEGYDLSLGGFNERANLSPRMLETFRDTLAIQKRFYEKTMVQLGASYFRSRRDFYLTDNSLAIPGLTTSANIESRTENALAFTSEFDYATNNSWELLIHGSLLSHDVGRQTHSTSSTQVEGSSLSPTINEFRISGDAVLQLTPDPSFFMTGGISTMDREEQDGVSANGTASQAIIDSASRVQELKNNQTRQTSLWLDVTTIPTYSDTFKLSLSNSILRYDTPSLLNDDDRDELRHVLRLLTRHRINQYLCVSVTAEANLTHLVYLASTRSSENTWNRVFRLSPSLSYQPSSGIVTVNTFEVLANYTVYDFEYLSSSIRSFTFRQFSWNDSSVVALTKRFAVEFNDNIRLYERGDLQWADFSERPLNYIEEQTYTGSVRYLMNELLVFSVGIRYFSQSRFTYSGSEKNEDFFLRSVGPTTAIDWSVGSRTHLVVKGWFEDLLQTGQQKGTNANMTMQCRVQL